MIGGRWATATNFFLENDIKRFIYPFSLNIFFLTWVSYKQHAFSQGLQEEQRTVASKLLQALYTVAEMHHIRLSGNANSVLQIYCSIFLDNTLTYGRKYEGSFGPTLFLNS